VNVTRRKCDTNADQKQKQEKTLPSK